MMRGTLVTAADYLCFRASLEPVLTAAFEAVRKAWPRVRRPG